LTAQYQDVRLPELMLLTGAGGNDF
jgi:hypothetical protein